jgi:anti-anti-sigma factor
MHPERNSCTIDSEVSKPPYYELLTILTRQKRVTINREKEQMLRIDIQSLNGVANLHCSGRVVFGVEVEMLRTMALSRPEACVRIDLARVEQIDATGLGLLVELQAWAKATKRQLTFLDPSEQVWRLIILTKLYSSLEISYSDEIELRGEGNQCARREMIA